MPINFSSIAARATAIDANQSDLDPVTAQIQAAATAGNFTLLIASPSLAVIKGLEDAGYTVSPIPTTSQYEVSW